MINPNQICYINSNPRENFGKSGKQFAVFFDERGDSYIVHSDGKPELAFKNDNDNYRYKALQAGKESGELIELKFQDILWLDIVLTRK